MSTGWVLPFLAAVGCASGVTREEFDALQKRHKDLEDRISALDSLVTVAEASVRRLEEKLGGGGKTTGATPQNAAAMTSEALLGLKTGKITTDDAASSLKGVARDAAPLLVEELRRAATDLKYANQIVAVLSRLPADAVRQPVGRALAEKTLVRIFAARIVGHLKDKEAAKDLEPHAATDDEDFRLAVGEAMVACRHAGGIPLLVRCLSSPAFANRVVAVDVLRRMNGGDDFGFRPGRPELNAAAIKEWEAWARGPGAKVFE